MLVTMEVPQTFEILALFAIVAITTFALSFIAQSKR